MSNKYSDIINLPHHESKTHPHMSRLDRAAQFAPFAALTGYEEAIIDAAKINEEKKLLASDEIDEIRNRLLVIESQLSYKPFIKIVYYEKNKENGRGNYLNYEGQVKNIDRENNKIVFVSGKIILFKQIYKIEL